MKLYLLQIHFQQKNLRLHLSFYSKVFYKQYFDKVECSVNDGVLTFKTIGFHQVEDDPERFDIKNLVINLKTDYKVESNADVTKKNVYSWYIDNTKEDYSMNFTIDSRSLANDKTQNNVLYLILSILFIVIMWSGYFIYKKVKEKNQIYVIMTQEMNYEIKDTF